MIILRDIELRRGSKLLLQHAGVTLQPGQRLALIGANGSGKSSLFAMLLGQLGADHGEIQGMNRLRLSQMAQEVHASEIPAGEYVWRGDQELCELRDRLDKLEAAEEYDRAAPLHSEMEAINGYDAERRARKRINHRATEFD